MLWNLSHGTVFYTVVTALPLGAMYYSICNVINVLLMTFYHVTRSSISHFVLCLIAAQMTSTLCAACYLNVRGVYFTTPSVVFSGMRAYMHQPFLWVFTETKVHHISGTRRRILTELSGPVDHVTATALWSRFQPPTSGFAARVRQRVFFDPRYLHYFPKFSRHFYIPR